MEPGSKIFLWPLLRWSESCCLPCCRPKPAWPHGWSGWTGSASPFLPDRTERSSVVWAGFLPYRDGHDSSAWTCPASQPRRLCPPHQSAWHWTVWKSRLLAGSLRNRDGERWAASARYSWSAFLRHRDGIWMRRTPRPLALWFLPRRVGSCWAAWTRTLQAVPVLFEYSTCLEFGSYCPQAAHGWGSAGFRAARSFFGSADPVRLGGRSDWSGWSC